MTENKPELEPIWRGVTVVGGDLQLTPSIAVGDDGEPSFSATVRVRTDMWPFWLEEAIDAAEAACRIAEGIPELDGALQAAAKSGEPDPAAEQALVQLLYRELRASMRAITGCAFAIDAFYATVKARCAPHPHAGAWRLKGTSRRRQIIETLRFHLRPNASQTKNLSTCVRELFALRNMAVHMAADWHDPQPRGDIHTSLDQRFVVFRRDNARIAVGNTMHQFDFFVSALSRGGEELAKCQPLADERMAQVWQLYEHASCLPELPRIARTTENDQRCG